MSGRRAKFLRRLIYGTDYSPRREARGTKTIFSVVGLGLLTTVTCDERRTAYQHAKRDWQAPGHPGPSPLRREPRRCTIPYWDTPGQRRKAWRNKS